MRDISVAWLGLEDRPFHDNDSTMVQQPFNHEHRDGLVLELRSCNPCEVTCAALREAAAQKQTTNKFGRMVAERVDTCMFCCLAGALPLDLVMFMPGM